MSSETRTTISGPMWWWSLLLLALAAIPDVMPYPGLKLLIAERFGLQDAGAQLFAIFALFGALAAVPMLRRARLWSPRKVLAIAALIQAVSISLMALPVDWIIILLLRCIQGYVDLILLVTLTTIVTASSRSTGRGFGVAGSAVLIGLAVGLALGGWLTSISASVVFPLSALVSVLIAVASLLLPSRPLASDDGGSTPARFRDRKVITAGAFSASDRMISGMMTVSLPLLLANSFEASPSVIGMVLAAPLLVCAIGGYFAGVLVDRVGAVPVRICAVPLQAAGLALVVISGGVIGVLFAGTMLLALGALLLMPTSLVIGTGRRPDEVQLDSVGGIQALGQAGHLFGVVSITLMSLLLGSVTSGAVLGLVGFYLLWNAGWLGFLRHAHRADTTSDLQDRLSRGPVAVRRLIPPVSGTHGPRGRMLTGASSSDLSDS